jgi:hypothetical protein
VGKRQQLQNCMMWPSCPIQRRPSKPFVSWDYRQNKGEIIWRYLGGNGKLTSDGHKLGHIWIESTICFILLHSITIARTAYRPKDDNVICVSVCHHFESLSPLWSLQFCEAFLPDCTEDLFFVQKKTGMRSFCTRMYVNLQNIAKISWKKTGNLFDQQD